MLFLILCSVVALNVLMCSRALCPRFSVCFSILITSLGEEGAGLCASRTFVCLFRACMFLSFFSSSWCRGLAAVCDCGISWTFLLTFYSNPWLFPSTLTSLRFVENDVKLTKFWHQMSSKVMENP